MRERIRQLVSSARRVTRTEPAEHTHPGSPIVRAHEAEALGAEAVRLARLAAALHMDQAAKLRARVAAMNSPASKDAAGAQPLETSR